MKRFAERVMLVGVLISLAGIVWAQCTILCITIPTLVINKGPHNWTSIACSNGYPSYDIIWDRSSTGVTNTMTVTQNSGTVISAVAVGGAVPPGQPFSNFKPIWNATNEGGGAWKTVVPASQSVGYYQARVSVSSCTGDHGYIGNVTAP